LPPPQQQCAAPLPNRPEEEALHLAEPASSTDDQPPMQTSADAAAASTHADRQTDAPLFWTTRQHSRTTSYHSISHLGPGTIQLEDHSEEQHEQSQGCWARSVTVDDYTVVSGGSGNLGAYVVWHLTVSTLKGGDMSIRKRYVLGFCYSAPGQCCIMCTKECSIFCVAGDICAMYPMLLSPCHSSYSDPVAAKSSISLFTDKRLRYSEFDRLRENLVKAFPHAEASIPKLPRKSIVSRFRPRFLEQRKNGLSHFIRYVFKNVCWSHFANTACMTAVFFSIQSLRHPPS